MQMSRTATGSAEAEVTSAAPLSVIAGDVLTQHIQTAFPQVGRAIELGHGLRQLGPEVVALHAGILRHRQPAHFYIDDVRAPLPPLLLYLPPYLCICMFTSAFLTITPLFPQPPPHIHYRRSVKATRPDSTTRWWV